MTPATFRAVLIDPFARAIRPIALADPGRDSGAFLRIAYAQIGTEDISCSRLPWGDTAWYDDLGARRPWDQQAFFTLPGFVGSLAGRWLIVRSELRFDADGSDYDQFEDCRADVAQLVQVVRWIAPQDAAVPAPTYSRAEVIDGRLVPVGPVIPVDPDAPRIWTFNNQGGGE